MVRRVGSNAAVTVHQRYRQLLTAGFNQAEAAALIAHAAGIDSHPVGETTCDVVWTWQQIAKIQFLRYLVDAGQLSG